MSDDPQENPNLKMGKILYQKMKGDRVSLIF